MKKKKLQKISPPGIAELIFDSGYLLFVILAGMIMIKRAGDGNTVLLLYGVMALVLGCGDAFHLIPRLCGHLYGMESYTKALGVGKLVTSITMTVFYLLLYGVWALHYGFPLQSYVGAALIALAAIRIILCLCPHNKWLSKDAPVKWGVYRNIPFFFIGVLIFILFAKTAWPMQDGFRNIPLAIALSFGFYIPVVLCSKKHPKIGALMMPKTSAYIWIVCMGFFLF